MAERYKDRRQPVMFRETEERVKLLDAVAQQIDGNRSDAVRYMLGFAADRLGFGEKWREAGEERDDEAGEGE